jgi:hypothetical protein
LSSILEKHVFSEIVLFIIGLVLVSSLFIFILEVYSSADGSGQYETKNDHTHDGEVWRSLSDLLETKEGEEDLC